MKNPAWATAVAAMLCLGGAHAATLPAGAVITGSPGLLGLDSDFADVPGTHITVVNASELEYLSADFAVGIDFFTDGSVVFYDNGGTGSLAGSSTFSFDFAGLADDIGGFSLVGGVAGGSASLQVLNGHSVSITLNDVVYTQPFGTFTAQISTVPEPGTWALMALGGLCLLAARRRGVVA